MQDTIRFGFKQLSIICLARCPIFGGKLDAQGVTLYPSICQEPNCVYQVFWAGLCLSFEFWAGRLHSLVPYQEVLCYLSVFFCLWLSFGLLRLLYLTQAQRGFRGFWTGQRLHLWKRWSFETEDRARSHVTCLMPFQGRLISWSLLMMIRLFSEWLLRGARRRLDHLVQIIRQLSYLHQNQLFQDGRQTRKAHTDDIHSHSRGHVGQRGIGVSYLSWACLICAGGSYFIVGRVNKLQ